MTEVSLDNIKNVTQKAIDTALIDIGEGAEDRAQEKAYIWTKLDTDSYQKMATKERTGETSQKKTITVADGMKKTGGYQGTDMDDEDNSNIQTLSQLGLGADTVEYMKLLKTKRR